MKLKSDSQPFPIIEPGETRGFMSAQNPFALKPGFLSILRNGRLDDGVIAARAGGVAISGNIAAGSYRGDFSAPFEGTTRIWLALASAGLVSIWQSLDGGVTWTEITAHAGPFGDTRLTDTGDPVAFAVVRDNPGVGLPAHDCLIISNNVDQPRVYAKSNGASDAFALNTFGMAISEPITAPADGAYVVAGPKGNGFDFGGSTTASNPSGFNLSGIPLIAETADAEVGDTITLGTFSASSDLNGQQIIIPFVAYPKILAITKDSSDNFPTPGTKAFTPDDMSLIEEGDILQIGTGDTSELVVVSSRTSSQFTAVTTLGHVAPFEISKQWVGVEATPDDYIFSIGDGTHEAVIWDPTGSSTGLLSFYSDAGSDGVPGGGHLFFVVCPTSAFADQVDLNAITTFKVALMRGHGATSQFGGNWFPWGIYPSGNVYFGASFSYGYGSTDARGVGATKEITDLKWSWPQFGGNLTLGFNDTRILLQYNITGIDIPGGDVAKGVNEVRIYSNLDGEAGKYLTDVLYFATYTGGAWTPIPSFWPQNPVDTVLPVQDLSYHDPQASALQIPIASNMTAANGRLFVCAGSYLWASYFQNPFLFYKTVITDPATGQLDPDSGVYNTFQGETAQTCVALGAVGGPAEQEGTPVTGVATLYILTDSNLYVFGGFDAITLSKSIPRAAHGTLSPWSVAKNENHFYWLDNRGQVRVCQGGQTKSISIEVVDDQFAQIIGSRLKWVRACCLDNRLFMAYSPTQTPGMGQPYRNLNLVVFSEVRGAWESIDVPAGYSAESAWVYYDQANSALRLMVFDSVTGRYVEHARPGATQDLATGGVLLLLKIRRLFADMIVAISVEACGILCDGATGKTLTVSRLALDVATPQQDGQGAPDPNPNVSTIPLTQANGSQMIAVYDEEGAGIEGVAVDLTLSGSVPGGWRLYAAHILARLGNERINRA